MENVSGTAPAGQEDACFLADGACVWLGGQRGGTSAGSRAPLDNKGQVAGAKMEGKGEAVRAGISHEDDSAAGVF